MFDLESMQPLLAMMPPSMAAALTAISDTIPRLGQQVMDGEITPEEAGRQLGEQMVPTFEAMAEDAKNATKG